MNNLYFQRKEIGKKPFTPDEIRNLLSKDFEIVKSVVTPEGTVSGLIVRSVKHPELVDPIAKGIEMDLQDDGGYAIDPRFMSDSEILFTEVIPDLMTDLELEYDETMN